MVALPFRCLTSKARRVDVKEKHPRNIPDMAFRIGFRTLRKGFMIVQRGVALRLSKAAGDRQKCPMGASINHPYIKAHRR
jgi:hypothetical protein